MQGEGGLGAQQHAGEHQVVAAPGRPRPVLRCVLGTLALSIFPAPPCKLPTDSMN